MFLRGRVRPEQGPHGCELLPVFRFREPDRGQGLLLNPGGGKHAQTHRGELEAVSTVLEVELVEFLEIDLLGAPESRSAQVRYEFRGSEEETERLAGCRHALRQTIEDQATLGSEGRGRKCVVKADGGARRQSRDVAQGSAKCI